MFRHSQTLVAAGLVCILSVAAMASASDVARPPSAEVHWAFVPPGSFYAPEVPDTDWPRSAVDRFVIARLNSRGLSPVADAERRTLLRRATYDLIGLPPTMDEMADFLSDESPDAFAHVVDRLLSSPHYGERWGRHWLDVARYADTAGETADFPIPAAYRYRNYVIDAFNEDLPYDEFLREQIAGDLLAEEDDQRRYTQRATATGFLAVSRRFGWDRMSEYHVTLGECIDTLGQSILGLTLGCARCHDHKYDPVSTEDYYALYGIFASTRFAFPGCEADKTPDDFVPLIPARQAQELVEARQKKLAIEDEHLLDLRKKLALLRVELSALEDRSDADGGIRIGDGMLSIEGNQPAIVVAKEVDAQDVVVRVAAASNAEAGIVLRFVDSDHFLLAHYAPQRKQIYFHEVVDGDYGAMRDAVEVGELGPLIELQAHVLGDQVTLTISDGEHTATAQHAIEKIRNAGRVGLFHNVTARQVFDHFEVAAPPQGVQFQDAFDGPSGASSGWLAIEGGWRADAAPASTGESVAEDSPGTGTAQLRSELKELESAREAAQQRRNALENASAVEVAYAVSEGEPSDARIHARGNPKEPGETVPRRFLEILGGDPLRQPGQSGRRELAEWLTRPENPLTARVMVNRIWLHHFGRGIVSSPNNFGFSGASPTHPQLLDYLARRFIDSGWSIKSIHRLLMLTRVYQLSSADHDANAEVDPNNRFLWRYQRRRLTAEEIRDAMLAISGELDRSRGQAHPFPPKSSWKFSQHTPFRPDHEDYATPRRSVYLLVQRNRRNPFLELFDGADPRVTTPQRTSSTTPAQALYLMNHPFLQQRADALADRLFAEQPAERQRISHLYNLALCRQPDAEEIAAAEAFLGEYAARLLQRGMPADEVDRPSWSGLARVLLRSNEFLYVD